MRYRGSEPRYRIRDRLKTVTGNLVVLIEDRRDGGEKKKREDRRKERSVTYASHYGNEDGSHRDRRFRGSIVETRRFGKSTGPSPPKQIVCDERAPTGNTRCKPQLRPRSVVIAFRTVFVSLL